MPQGPAARKDPATMKQKAIQTSSNVCVRVLFSGPESGPTRLAPFGRRYVLFLGAWRIVRFLVLQYSRKGPVLFNPDETTVSVHHGT